MKEIRFDGKLDFTIDNISFFNVLRDENFTVHHQNGKDRYTLIFVENGEMGYRFTKTNDDVTLTKGSVIFIPKDTPYTAIYKQNGTIAKVLTFSIIQNSTTSQFNDIICKKDDNFFAFFNTFSINNTNNTVFLAGKIYELIYLIEKDNANVPKKYKKILPALDELHNNYFENKKIIYYANLCHMSEPNFRRLFKKYTGKSFIEYRNFTRILFAKKMIDSGEFTVSEVAYLVGFNNMSFFYEVFNKYYPKK